MHWALTPLYLLSDLSLCLSGWGMFKVDSDSGIQHPITFTVRHSAIHIVYYVHIIRFVDMGPWQVSNMVLYIRKRVA